MPGGLLGAISGILAGGILGFGAAEWSVLSSLDLALFAGVLCLFLCKIPIQRHLPPHWSCLVRALSPVLLLFVAFWCFCVFLLCCFLLLVSFGPDLTLDYVTVLTPLLTPQCGTSNCICTIRSSARQCATTWREPQRRRTEKKTRCIPKPRKQNTNTKRKQKLRIFSAEIDQFGAR